MLMTEMYVLNTVASESDVWMKTNVIILKCRKNAVHTFRL